MIKPASYWALHKTANVETLGRIGLALAGREVELNPPLSYAESCLVSVIRQDSEWMDESIANRKKRIAESVKAYRARKKEAAEKEEPNTEPPPPPPTPQEESEEPTAAESPKKLPIPTDKHIYPERDYQELYARQMNVPLEYIDIFNERIREMGYQYINRNGATVNINRNNWKSVLKKFYEQDKKNEQKKNAPSPNALQQDGYKAEMEMA